MTITNNNNYNLETEITQKFYDFKKAINLIIAKLAVDYASLININENENFVFDFKKEIKKFNNIVIIDNISLPEEHWKGKLWGRNALGKDKLLRENDAKILKNKIDNFSRDKLLINEENRLLTWSFTRIEKIFYKDHNEEEKIKIMKERTAISFDRELNNKIINKMCYDAFDFCKLFKSDNLPNDWSLKGVSTDAGACYVKKGIILQVENENTLQDIEFSQYFNNLNDLYVNDYVVDENYLNYLKHSIFENPVYLKILQKIKIKPVIITGYRFIKNKSTKENIYNITMLEFNNENTYYNIFSFKSEYFYKMIKNKEIGSSFRYNFNIEFDEEQHRREFLKEHPILNSILKYRSDYYPSIITEPEKVAFGIFFDYAYIN